MSEPTRSAYELALGSRLAELHPVLRRYFAAIPAGSIGIGEGVFEVFGTERWWLRPFLVVAERCQVIVPGLHREVPFRVENRTESGRQTATRTLWLESGEWSMVDAVSYSRGRGRGRERGRGRSDSFRPGTADDGVVDVPLLGRVYEYTGTFTYRIEQDTPAAE